MTQSNIKKTKAALLSQAIRHIDIITFDARPIIDSMRHMSFTARSLANAADIFNQMLQDESCTIILTLAGSTAAGGCMKIYSDFIRYNMVDVIVATGASIVDMNFFETLGFKHYRGSHQEANDKALRDLYIDRIYDTYINEEELQICDNTLREIADQLEPKAYSSREFIQAISQWLVIGAKKQDALVQLAYEKSVPIFCPAFTDSSAGFGLVKHQPKHPNNHITLDSIRDFHELTAIKIEAITFGLFIIGGSAPKNFAQDTVACAEILGKTVNMHEYAIQITVADVRDGSCSSSTLKEACSWGKVSIQNEQMVYAEATSVLPLLASDTYHRGHWKKRKPKCYTQYLSACSKNKRLHQ